MSSASLRFQRIVFLLASLSLFVKGSSLAEPVKGRSIELKVSASQVHWWSPSGFLVEPEDFEESSEEDWNTNSLSFVSTETNGVPLSPLECVQLSFLSIFSGQLQFLNIPPPAVS